MKRLLFLIISFLIFLCIKSNSTEKYSLAQYISMVLSENQELKLKGFKLKQSEAVVKSKQKLGPLQTNLSFDNASSNRLSTDILDSVDIVSNKSKNVSANLSKTFITGSNLGISYGYSFLESNSRKLPEALRSYHSSNVNINLSQPLLAGLSNIYNRRELRIAQFDNKLSDLELHKLMSDIIIKAIESYYGLMLAQKQVKIKKQGLDIAKAHAKMLENLVEKELETEQKLLEHRAQLLEKENAVYSSENDFLEKLSTFLELVNITQNVHNVELTSSPMNPFPVSEKISLESIIEDAYKSRNDYQTAKTKVSKAKVSLDIKKSKTLPDLSLKTNYYIYGTDPGFDETFSNMGSNDFNSWSVGLNFVLTVDRGYRKNQVQPLAMALKESQYHQNTLQTKIRRDLNRILSILELNYKQYMASKNALSLAENNFKDAKILLDKGFISGNDLLEHQKNREMSEYQHLNSLIQFTLNIYRLKEKQGRLLSDFNVIK
ncbi:MAG: TolC family protein [bacterium]